MPPDYFGLPQTLRFAALAKECIAEVSAKSHLPAFLAQRRIRKALFLLPSVFCHLSSVGCKMTFCTRLIAGMGHAKALKIPSQHKVS